MPSSGQNGFNVRGHVDDHLVAIGREESERCDDASLVAGATEELALVCSEEARRLLVIDAPPSRPASHRPALLAPLLLLVVECDRGRGAPTLPALATLAIATAALAAATLAVPLATIEREQAPRGRRGTRPPALGGVLDGR